MNTILVAVGTGIVLLLLMAWFIGKAVGGGKWGGQ
jgi:hypothetical protein